MMLGAMLCTKSGVPAEIQTSWTMSACAMTYLGERIAMKPQRTKHIECFVGIRHYIGMTLTDNLRDANDYDYGLVPFMWLERPSRRG